MNFLPAFDIDLTALSTSDFLSFASSVLNVSDTLRCILSVNNTEVDELLKNVKAEAARRGLTNELGI